MVFAHADGIVSVLLDHTHTRGPSVARVRDFLLLSHDFCDFMKLDRFDVVMHCCFHEVNWDEGGICRMICIFLPKSQGVRVITRVKGPRHSGYCNLLGNNRVQDGS
jgi:hypothetical protein